MSIAEAPGSSGTATRTAAQLHQDRQRAIAAWEASALAREQAELARRENRQAGTEARRRLEALHRVSAALREHAGQATPDAQRLPGDLPPRAIVVHRLDWMRERLTQGLGAEGLEVVATGHDGADGLGFTIAEQPDLLVVEDRLPSVPALDLVSALREFAPATVVAAQAENGAQMAALVDAGVSVAFSRRIPPADICAQLAGYLRDRPGTPLIVA